MPQTSNCRQTAFKLLSKKAFLQMGPELQQATGLLETPQESTDWMAKEFVLHGTRIILQLITSFLFLSALSRFS